jgi:hypothetical protein
MEKNGARSMLRNIDTWIGSYIKRSIRRIAGASVTVKPLHIIFCLVDHFEPKWGHPDRYVETARMHRWIEKYRETASWHKDADGSSPRRSFFYPQEEYEKAHLDCLAAICCQGFGEVEIHLHHDNDTAQGLKYKIENFKERLESHGLLSIDKLGNTRFGFIHGNWALDNSRADGRWCGVNNELEILRDTGCYADFTLPSAPSDTQTSKINSIYYAKDTAEPKSHNTGIDVKAGLEPSGDLMIIQGPLALNRRRRRAGVIPRIENSEITLHNPPTDDRVDLWIDQRISVKGRPDWIFVKIYTHGLQDDNLKDEYFKNLDHMFDYLEKRYNDDSHYKLHYVTAREMYNIIKAAEAGEAGGPGMYRDYMIKSNIRPLTIGYKRKAVAHAK